YEGGEQKVKVTTKDQAWTATVEGEGVTVTPMEGPAGETEVTITVAANTLGSRAATVTFTTATGKSKDVSINQGAAPTSATIKEFVTEYVKLIDVWMKNVGTVNVVTGVGANNDSNDIENAHYIPDDTVVKVGEIEYNLADALELASRSYLLLRGYDGHNTTAVGAGKVPATDIAYTMDSNLPETHSYQWNLYPYAERTNGGAFKMITSEGEFELVRVDLLDNYTQRHTNYPLGNGAGKISNFCGYTNNQLAGYGGTCCAKRITLAYAYFFKYMLDNNLQDAKSISPDQTFEAPLFGENMGAPTIKAFAQEYIKVLDIWQNTTGSVSYTAQTGVTEGGSIADAHYIPLDTKFNILGAEYGTADMFELALRSYLLLRGYDATATDKVGAGAFATLEAPWKMSDNFPTTHGYAWGPTPYNEAGTTDVNGGVTGNGGGLRMGTPAEGGVEKVKVDLLDNFAQRNVNYPLGSGKGNISNMSGYSNKIPGYYGCMSAMRALYTYAQFFKYMLDNNLEDATAIPADQTFDSYLFGEGKF
ncbi:MAG: BACON domain-containing protein, partial [Prevotella sp.]|nr:BACON domain-containing protein [Prevotella sp.]